MDLQSTLDSLPDNQLMLLVYKISIQNDEYLLNNDYYQLAVRYQSQAHVHDTIDRGFAPYVRQLTVYTIGNGGYENNFIVNSSGETQTHQAGKNIIMRLVSRQFGTPILRVPQKYITICLGKLMGTVYGLTIGTDTGVGIVQEQQVFGTKFGGTQDAIYPSNDFSYAARYV